MLRKIQQRIERRFPISRANPDAAIECAQKQIIAGWKTCRQAGGSPLSFNDVGFSVHSQHEEDGILLYLFSLIGSTNRQLIEICCGTGWESNGANLIASHGWTGLLFEGDAAKAGEARDFFSRKRPCRFWPPVVESDWVTAENINDLIRHQGIEGEIDLLSLDLDGIDWWLWKALDCVRPRVVVAEVNHLWGPEKSVTVPYDPAFAAEFTEHGSDYAGASLGAFVKLGKEKGYRFIGTNAIATNAFFLRDDIEESWLPEADPVDCFDHPRARFGMEQRLPGVRDREWVEV